MAALETIDECLKAGATYSAQSGFRDFAAQNRLYAQGRTTPGHIITKAHGGESAHNFGLAIDFVRNLSPDPEHVIPDWKESDYNTLGAAAKAHQLAWGGDFADPDRPHIQWLTYISKDDLAPLRALHQLKWEGDLQWLHRIWAEIDRRRAEAAAVA